MSFSALPAAKPSPAMLTSNISRNGVSIMPNTLEAAALQTAAGTFPRAIAVKAMEDETAEGNTPRYRNPYTRSSGIQLAGTSERGHTRSGNTTKVMVVMIRCSFQWPAPARTCLRESAAPWRKNSRATAPLPVKLNCSAKPPSAGNMVARPIVPSRTRVKPSTGTRITQTPVHPDSLSTTSAPRRLPLPRRRAEQLPASARDPHGTVSADLRFSPSHGWSY